MWYQYHIIKGEKACPQQPLALKTICLFFFFFSPLLEAGSHVAEAFLYNLLCSQGWSLTYYVGKDNLELLTHLPLSPWCWDYRLVAPHRVYMMGPSALCMLTRQTLYQLSYSLSTPLLTLHEFINMLVLDIRPSLIHHLRQRLSSNVKSGISNFLPRRGP